MPAVRGFQLAMGLVDFGVVLLLAALLRRRRLPDRRLIWYAWNPLAIWESAASGHIEPVGVALILAAVLWLRPGRRLLSAGALATAVAVKLVPLLLAPSLARRLGRPASVAMLLLGLLWFLPFAWSGPAVGGGLFAYAERWQYNASVFALVHGLLEVSGSAGFLTELLIRLQREFPQAAVDWDLLYRNVWPAFTARVVVAGCLAGWVGYLWRRSLGSLEAQWLAILGGLLILSPTVHPWYALWMLPFAAACASPTWLLFAALLPLSYLTPPAADVPLGILLIEYGFPTILALAQAVRSRTVAAGRDRMQR